MLPLFWPLWVMAWLGITMSYYYYYSHKEREELDNDHGINGLPDDILCNIVSRLKSIEASRTSILSKRWRKIWTMNCELRFSFYDTLDHTSRDFVDCDEISHYDVDYGDRQRFFKAVNQCLELYTGHNLKSFSMHCCFLKSHMRRLERWIQTVARLDVEELHLGDYCLHSMWDDMNNAFIFSFKLINGVSRLRKLGLRHCYVETSFVGQCNSLVSLFLWAIPLLGHELSDILLACPNLTSLVIEQCDLSPNFRISGPNLKLETLELVNCHNVQRLDILGCNLVAIVINLWHNVEILLSSVPKLERLHLRTHGMRYHCGNVPRDLPQLKFLSIQSTSQMLCLPPRFQVFGNVRILYLLMKGYNSGEAEVDLWNFAPVLSVCPLLEEFYLSVGSPFCEKEREVRCPAMRHKHLKHTELSGFSNTQHELEFAKFILTSAEVLCLLLLRSAIRGYNGRLLYFIDQKDATDNLYFVDQKDVTVGDAQVICENLQEHEDVTEGDAQVICENLRGHALSMSARVEIC